MDGIREVCEKLGAFQHLEREKAVNALTWAAAKDTFPDLWPQVQEEFVKLQRAEAWEANLGSLLGAQVVIPVVDDADYITSVQSFALSLLSHREVRVRNAVAETLGVVARKNGASVWESCRDQVLSTITTNFERSEDADEQSKLDDRDTPGSPSLGAAGRGIPQGSQFAPGTSPGGPSLISSLLTSAYEPQKPGVGDCRHQTEGWKALESSVRCVHRIVEGSGADFAPHATPEVREIIYDCFSHMNRFVRETAFIAITALCTALKNTSELSEMAVELSEKLRDGLSDNWSQVLSWWRYSTSTISICSLPAAIASNEIYTRLLHTSQNARVRCASSKATRELLQGVPEDTHQSVMHLLLPAMCLNSELRNICIQCLQAMMCRSAATPELFHSPLSSTESGEEHNLDGHYVAEGVRTFSQETWKQLFPEGGKDKANNHAVREAACACIGELCEKVPQAAVEPNVPQLLAALLICFRDESWPCRDAAAAGTSALVATYPDAAAPQLGDLWKLWFEHLGDNVPSVRANAAAAIGKVAPALPEDTLSRSQEWLKQSLTLAKNQEESSEPFSSLENVTTFGVATPKAAGVMNDPKHTDQAMFSCGSLAPKLRSGCMDHSFAREMEPWEVSDGALWLLKELAAPFPDLVCEKLPEASELASLRHFDRCHKLHETLWTTLPGIGQGVGKRQFKPYLELFLPYVFKDLRCGNQLCEAAAGCCIAFFRDWLGQSIFSGRLDDLQMREMQNCSKIPARVHIPNAEPCKNDAAVNGSAEKKGIAARMRELPPGSGIPNLLAK